ncbi:MAG: hypothetical protein AB9882_00385 [Ignavibacteriaceae bacterium]
MKKAVFLLSLVLILNIFPQGTAGEEAKFQYRYLIDMPSSGILERGYVSVSNDVMPFGVLISKMEVGVFDGLCFGISYGGENIIGSGNPKWFKLPGVNVRFKLFDEAIALPSITLGFDSQGKGIYLDSTNRYSIKSPGFFAALTKNYEVMGYLSLHGSVNYSLEHSDGDNFVNFMVGVEKTIGKRVSLLLEYDFAFNDNNTDHYGTGNGYCNLGVRWSLGDGLTLGLDLRDLFSNQKLNPGSADRAIKIEYIRGIF